MTLHRALVVSLGFIILTPVMAFGQSSEESPPSVVPADTRTSPRGFAPETAPLPSPRDLDATAVPAERSASRDSRAESAGAPLPADDALELFGSGAPQAVAEPQPQESRPQPVMEPMEKVSIAPVAPTVPADSKQSESGLSPRGVEMDAKDRPIERQEIQMPPEAGAAEGQEGGSRFGNRPSERQELGGGREDNPSYLGDLWPLLIVLGLIGVGTFLIYRFRPARRMLTGVGVVDVVSRTSLSPKQSVVLVKMGRRLVLLGVTPDRITTLSEQDDPDQVAMILGEAASGRPDSMTQSFAREFDAESSAYLGETRTRSQALDTRRDVRGLLEKVRQYAHKRDVA